MKKHSSWQDYAKDVSQKLPGFFQSIRLPEVEAWLERSFWLYSFVQEDIDSEITENKDVAQILLPLITVAHDLLRGLIHAQGSVLLAAATLQCRTAFEIRCTIAFITENQDPKKYADRFARYADVERFAYQSGSPNAPKLPEAELEAIRRRCPEWFRPDGTLRPRMNWTADEQTNSIKRIAEAVGLLEDYQRGYALSSKITHGSPAVRNFYRGTFGSGALFLVADPAMCASQTILGASHCLMALIDFCLFAGIALPQEEIFLHQMEVKRLMQAPDVE